MGPFSSISFFLGRKRGGSKEKKAIILHRTFNQNDLRRFPRFENSSSNDVKPDAAWWSSFLPRIHHTQKVVVVVFGDFLNCVWKILVSCQLFESLLRKLRLFSRKVPYSPMKKFSGQLYFGCDLFHFLLAVVEVNRWRFVVHFEFSYKVKAQENSAWYEKNWH